MMLIFKLSVCTTIPHGIAQLNITTCKSMDTPTLYARICPSKPEFTPSILIPKSRVRLLGARIQKN